MTDLNIELLDAGRFTPRQADAIVPMAMGVTDKVAARRLGISPKTLAVHYSDIYEKLGLKEAQLEGNIVGMNMRVLAISTMVARKIIRISSAVAVNSVFAFIFINALTLDSSATRARGGRVGHFSARVRVAGRDA